MDARKTCRTCLAPAENMYSIYQIIGDKDDMRLLDVIEAVNGSEVNMSVGLPESVCAHCYKDLVYIHQFSVKCKISEAALVNIFVEDNLIEVDSDVQEEYISLCSYNEREDDSNNSWSLDLDPTKDRAMLPIIIDPLDGSRSDMQVEHTTKSDEGATVKSKRHASQRPFKSNTLTDANLMDLEKSGESIENVQIIGNFVCEICKKTCNFESQFTNHMKLHDPNRKFECDICKYRFTSMSSLAAHKFTHSDHRPFVCHICDRAFRRENELERHMIWHSTEKPFVCEVCHKGCKTLRILKTHMFVHTKEKPFVCGFCGRGFSQAPHLKTHRRTHTGERPYACKKCPMRFSTSAHCKTHELCCNPQHIKLLKGSSLENNTEDQWKHILDD